MKIVVAAPSQIPARRANTLQVMKMAQAFIACGHEVQLFSPFAQGSPQSRPTWDELARLYGLHTTGHEKEFSVEWLPAYPRFKRYDYALHAVRRAQNAGADLFFTRLPQAGALASLVGLPVILEVHDLPRGALGPRFFGLFLKGSGKRRLVVITHALARDLAAHLGAPPPDQILPGVPGGSAFTLVAPDGVDIERYANLAVPQAARQDLALPGLQVDCFTAGYSGHLYPGKGSSMLLELASRLPAINFLWVGGEPQAVEDLRQEALGRGLSNVILTGFVPNVDLPRYQAACEVLLAPYSRQVQGSSGGDIAAYFSPLKLFEYMACGRAILCTDLPALREVLNEQNAILLPPDDPSAWTAAIQAMQQEPEHRARLGEQARLDARRYTWEQRARAILEGIPEASA